MAAAGGFDGTLVLMAARFSPLPGALYPWLSGEGSGVVDLLFRVGFVDVAEVADGRVPIGATAVPWPGLLFGGTEWGGEPPGEDVLVRLDCWAGGPSKTPLLPAGLDCGLAVLPALDLSL